MQSKPMSKGHKQETRDTANLRHGHLEEKNSHPGLKSGSDDACYKTVDPWGFVVRLSASEDLVFIGFLL